MSSKLDRWKKISADAGGNQSIVNPNKAQLLKDLSTIPVLVDPPSSDDNATDNPSKTENNDKDNSGIRSDNMTPTDGVEKGDADGNSKLGNSVKEKRGGKSKSQESLANKVNNNLRYKVENKVTKDMTHKKTSFLLTLQNLAKLHNFDMAHGGRVKGEFINNLLEEAFSELEKDPEWKNTLNSNLDLLMEQIAKGRKF